MTRVIALHVYSRTVVLYIDSRYSQYVIFPQIWLHDGIWYEDPDIVTQKVAK